MAIFYFQQLIGRSQSIMSRIFLDILFYFQRVGSEGPRLELASRQLHAVHAESVSGRAWQPCCDR
jgi:hypothetical protein